MKTPYVRADLFTLGGGVRERSDSELKSADRLMKSTDASCFCFDPPRGEYEPRRRNDALIEQTPGVCCVSRAPVHVHARTYTEPSRVECEPFKLQRDAEKL